MLGKISINQLEKILSDGICHKNSANESTLFIRINRDYEFYYNFDYSYNMDDKDFIFTITNDFENLDAIGNDGNYIEGEIDIEYLSSEVERYKDEILYKLS